MNKSASILSAGKFRRMIFIKPLAFLLALMMMPKLPFLGSFSLAPNANAQITLCGRQASIFQVCAQASNAFEAEAIKDFEAQYNLKPGDGNLIYQYGRADLRMDFRAFMFDKLLAAIKNSAANRTPVEQGMIDYFTGVVQQHEIAMYTAGTGDRDLFLNHFCQWKPDFDIQGAYDAYMSTLPYCGATFTGPPPIFGGSPDLPTKEYFITKGFGEAYVKPLEAVIASNQASLKAVPNGAAAALQINQTQAAEIAAFTSVSVLGPGVMVASKAVPLLRYKIWPNLRAKNTLKQKRAKVAIDKQKLKEGIKEGEKIAGETEEDLTDVSELLATVGRVAGVVGAVLLVASIVVGAVMAAEAAEERQQTMNDLNKDLDNAKNYPPNLDALMQDDVGLTKITAVFLELTLPEFESSETLPLPGANDPQFITNSASVTNRVGPITFIDQFSRTWTVQPYGQNWFVQTGKDRNLNAITKFSNAVTYWGPDSNNNKTAYKAWINNGAFMVAKLNPGDNDQICEAGSNGIYQGETTNCASFSSDHLTMFDTNNNPMNITMSQAVGLDSPNPGYVAFPQGLPRFTIIQAHGIPAPTFTVVGALPPGIGLLNYATTPGIATIELAIAPSQPAGTTKFDLVISNSASTITVPFTVTVDTPIKITSPTIYSMTYGVPVNFTVTATGEPVHFTIDNVFPDGIKITENGNGTARIAGTPVKSGKVLGCFKPGGGKCGVTASNDVYSDFSEIQLSVGAPSANWDATPQATFRAGEFNQIVLHVNGGVTAAGINVYHIVDACSAVKPAWLTETPRPNGDLVLSGTPPLADSSLGTVHLGFDIPLVGAQDFLLSGCRFDVFPPAIDFALTVDVFPIFSPGTSIVATPGSPIPDNSFPTLTPNFFTVDGALPQGVNFNQTLGGFSFSGFLAVGTPPGDYKLKINAQTINANTGSEDFHFIVAQAPQYNGFGAYNVVIGQPAAVVLNAKGFPKNAIDQLPAMTSTFRITLPPGVSQVAGAEDGSIALLGTPTMTWRQAGILHVSNGIAPDLFQTVEIRAIKPGDINADGVVDCGDVNMVKSALNAKLGFSGYNNLADVNNDGIVNALDLALVSKNLAGGTRCQ